MRGKIFFLLCFAILLIPGSLLSQSLVVNAGNDTTVYLGYGPETGVLTANATGGHPPYLFVWSTGDSTQTIVIHPLLTAYYKVTVIDSLNNTAVDSVLMKVSDVRCGQKNDKVKVCHRNFIICIDEHAVPAHLEHGDMLGDCIITGFGNSGTPVVFKLYDNYPNPFNPVTRISYALPKSGIVTLKVYNVLGAEVSVLVNEFKNAGYYSVDFNATNLSSGVYFYRLETNGLTDTKKMAIVK